MAGGIRPELIPIKKSVVDLTKGVILRTYYMRPDKLKRLINDITTEPIKKYTTSITSRDDVERILTSGHGDASAFSGMFPNSKSVEFSSIISRTKVKDAVYETNPSEYNIIRCCQLLTSYVLSLEDMYLIGFKHAVKDAMKNYSLKVTEITTPILPKEKKEKQRKLKTEEDQLEFTYPKHFISLEKQLNINKIPEEYRDRVGVTLQTNIRTKLTKFDDSKKCGIQLSRFLNFIHPTANKVSNILAKLVDKNYRNNDYLIHNLILLPEMYEEKEFTSALSASLIYDIAQLKAMDALDVIDTNFDFYKYLLLNKIDKTKFNEIYKTYPNNKYDIVYPYLGADKNIIELLASDKLSVEEKASFILMMGSKNLKNNFKDIRKFITVENEVEDLYLVSSIMDALICRQDLNIELCNALISTVEKSRGFRIFSFENMLDEAINSKIYGIEPTYNYLFLQTIFAKYLKIFYIPYDIAHKTCGLPYSTFIPNKLFTLIYPKIIKEFGVYIKNNTVTGVSGYKELYMPTITNTDLKDLDNQIFIRVDPVEILSDVKPQNGGYITLKVPNDKVYTFEAFDKNTYYIVFDLIKHIK